MPLDQVDELLAEHQKCPEKREAQTILAGMAKQRGVIIRGDDAFGPFRD